MKLSKRLETVASFAGRGIRIADVGTDHGYIPIALVKENLVKNAIAMDIRPGPLERAREHIRQYGLENRIETRLSDGVERLAAGEADAVIIAGMGGELVIHILEGGRHLWDFVEHWILSPQSELDKVRKYLAANGFEIVKEAMVEEDKKYYTVMEAVCCRIGGPNAGQNQAGSTETATEGRGTGKGFQGEMSEAEYLYGPILIKEKNPVLKEFLEREERQLGKIVNELEEQTGPKAAARMEELEKRLCLIRKTITIL